MQLLFFFLFSLSLDTVFPVKDEANATSLCWVSDLFKNWLAPVIPKSHR